MTPTSEKSIQFIKGIGPKRAEILAKVGIETLSDVLEYFPRAYKNRADVTPVREVVPDSEATVKGKITSVRLKKYFYRRSMVVVILEQDGVSLVLRWFNQPYMRDKFKRGMVILASGKVVMGKDDQYSMTNPDTEVIDEESESEHLNSGRIVPIYPLTESLTQGFMRSLVYKARNEAGIKSDETLPTEVLLEHNLIPRGDAIRGDSLSRL